MSFEETPGDGGSAEVGPAPSGDTGTEATPQEPVAEPEPARQYVEIDDPDNRFVRVKVAGEDVEVPFSEALRGYSREADYTQKAQAVAREREENAYALNLHRALQANPEMTLQILQQQFGLNQPPPQYQPEPEQEYADPLERQLNEERQARMALEQRINERDADSMLQSAIGGLRQQFGVDDDDVRQIVGTAYQLGLGVEALPMIYKTMAFDRISARVAAHQAEQQRVQAEQTRRQAAAADATRTIGNGGSANGITNQLDVAGQHMSIRDALEAAFREHEGR